VNVGIFGCDPGGHTGLAWGIFDPRAEIGDALRGRMNAGSATVTGSEREQIREITSWWAAFYRQCIRSALLPPDRVWIAMEDFVLKPGDTAGGRDATSPLALIWGFEGYRMGRADEWYENKRGQNRQVAMPPMITQMAGQAKSYATKTRIREWDLWVVGKEHERSAWAHVALLLKRIQQQGLA
jgi:hypothetical protein